jgi:hypothetical protein
VKFCIREKKLHIIIPPIMKKDIDISSWVRPGDTMAEDLGVARLLQSLTNGSQQHRALSYCYRLFNIVVGCYSYRKVIKEKNNTIMKHSFLVVSIISGAYF